MLAWKTEYSIGVNLIDEQHKYLFEVFDSAFQLLKEDTRVDKYDAITLIIQDLCQYAKYHFVTEENYMLRINYMGYSSQKVEHDEFIQYMNKIDFEHVGEDTQKYIEDLLAYLLKWLIDHVLLKDKLIPVE